MRYAKISRKGLLFFMAVIYIEVLEVVYGNVFVKYKLTTNIMSNEAIGALGYLGWFLILFIGNLWYSKSRFGRVRWDVALYYAGAALMATGFIHAIGYVIFLVTIQYK